MPDSQAIVFQPIELPFSGKNVKNRFLKSAMTERLCTFDKDDLDKRGKPTPQYEEVYRQWGQGDIGIVSLGNIPCHREHLEAPGNAILDKDAPWDVVEAFKPVIKVTQANGSLCIGQITHAGRQCPDLVRKDPVSASPNDAFDAMGMHFNASRALTEEEIADVRDRYGWAAEALYKAGADGAQLHAAHGYLLSQFLSAKTNRRTDKYGGSFENRSRLIFEIFEEIDKRIPDKSFVRAIKINSHDFQGDAWTADDCAQLVEKLELAGVDLIELSGGSYQTISHLFDHTNESTKKREGFFLEWADKIKPYIKKSVLCVTGGFRSLDACADAISNGTCQMVGMARPLTADPQLPKHFSESNVKGAADNLIDSSIQTPASVAQMHSIAEKRAIQDYSVKEVAEEWTKRIKGQDWPKPAGNYPPA